MEMEIEELQRKIGSMAEKQMTIEKSQESILRTQNTILCRLLTIERALRAHPREHSTPFRYQQHRFLRMIMAVNGTEQTPSTHLQVTLFDHLHTVRVLSSLFPKTISTASAHLIFQPTRPASTCILQPTRPASTILQPTHTASTCILQLTHTASTHFILQLTETRFLLQVTSIALTSKVVSTAWMHLSLFLLNLLVKVCLLPRLTRCHFMQPKPLCTNSLNFIANQK